MKKQVLLAALLVYLIIISAGCIDKTDSEGTKEETAVANTEEITSKTQEEVTKTEVVIGEDVKLVADTPVNYTFRDVSVHDPSLIDVNGVFYIFGSHLAGAKSEDLMTWKMVGNGVTKSNPIIPDALTEMKESFEWAKTATFWAPDVIQLEDGKFYMYYCNCEGSSPLSSLGVAVADNVEGPYKNLGIILKSGMSADILSENGDVYDATKEPNVVDPCLFYDEQGKLWMVYGSYSGGIFILQMDPKTGFPLEKGYGKQLLGGNHARIEGAFTIYSPETKYYYMFLSFGGYAADGGYNIRVVRSESPDGPYYDANGNDMINCKGAEGTLFDDESIYPYGVKIMGNFRFDYVKGEENPKRTGYVSPGHNSAYYNEETGQYFLIFHTRFENKGETHKVRVHQMYLNEDGWPVVSPYRYVGEKLGSYTKEDAVGIYKYLNHGNAISADIVGSELIELNADNTITGAVSGTWKLDENGTDIEINIGEDTYKGVLNLSFDEQGKKNVMTFTALSDKGIAIWGSGLSAVE